MYTMDSCISIRSARAREECLEMQAQTNALQSTIEELEQKLVEVCLCTFCAVC